MYFTFLIFNAQQYLLFSLIILIDIVTIFTFCYQIRHRLKLQRLRMKLLKFIIPRRHLLFAASIRESILAHLWSVECVSVMINVRIVRLRLLLIGLSGDWYILVLFRHNLFISIQSS